MNILNTQDKIELKSVLIGDEEKLLIIQNGKTIQIDVDYLKTFLHNLKYNINAMGY